MDSTTFSSSSSKSIAIATLSILLVTKLILSFITNKKKKKYPPCPLSLPIIGHLYLFKKPLHRALASISARQGNAPALLLRFGSRPVLVVSSRHLADECFTKNDLAFANRPHLPSLKRISYDHSTFDNLNYGPHWRNLRRVAIVSGLSAHRLNSFSHFRASEIHAVARGLFRDYNNAGPTSAGQMHRVTDLRERLFELSIKNIMTMVLGKRYYDEERSEKARRFQECIEEVFEVSGASNVADFVPLLGKLDVNGLQKKLLQLGKHRDEALQALLDEEKRKQSGGGKEFVEGEDKKKSMIAELVELQRAEPDFYTDQMIKALISVSQR